MEQRVLLYLRVQLINRLHSFTDIVVNRLQVLGLFTESTKLQVAMSNCTSMQQSRNMLDAMVRCESPFFALFLQCLNDVGLSNMTQNLKDTRIALERGWEKLPGQ